MLTWIEINKKALDNNIKQFRKHIGPKILLMPVIKSNAYGHGFLEVATVCENNKDVDRLCVVSLDEAETLRAAGITKPILILALYELDPQKLRSAIFQNIIFPLYSLEQAQALNRVGGRLRRKVKVHFKIDIGTTRIGILPAELPIFLKQLESLSQLEYEGVFGHFASSEEDVKRTIEQQAIFEGAIDTLVKNGFPVPIRHSACSAATILYPKTHFTAVRIGLALYGLDPSNDTQKVFSLRPALEWYTKIIQVRHIPVGSKISYGGTFATKRPTTLAILPIGYWDGYDRGFSNKAYVIIRGRRCPVRGRVCMNLTMVDVTSVLRVKVGDSAQLIGGTIKEQITADELAKLAGTINYEVVTRINPQIPRIVV